MVSSFQALRSTFISIISYFISYNSYFLSHDMTGYHGQKYQTYKKLLKCSVVLGMYIGIFEKVKGILRFTSSYIGTIPMKPWLTAIGYAPELIIKSSKWSLRVCYHFSQGQVINNQSNLATVATVILWSWAETVTLCSPSTVWDDNSSTMVKQANFVDKLSSNYFHNITRWRATVTLRSLSWLSLRRSVRSVTVCIEVSVFVHQ